jgi:hypothetical protein
MNVGRRKPSKQSISVNVIGYLFVWLPVLVTCLLLLSLHVSKTTHEYIY